MKRSKETGFGPLLSASADTLRGEGLTDPTIAALKIAQATALRLLEARIEKQPILSSWDARVPSTYQALSVGNAFGIQFYILFTCGNVVEFGPPPKPTPPPAPKPAPTPVPTATPVATPSTQ